jgi:alanine dehydrogenase
MKIGIIREAKIPPDKRAPLTPGQCRQLMESYRDLEIVAESSPDRCFTDDEYTSAGIRISRDLSGCDVLLGIKEVPHGNLIPGKTYFFFSHTVKKQPHNRNMFREIIRKAITLIDYETLTGKDGSRIIGFGRFAGLVGAYNGLRAYGIRRGLYSLKPAQHCAGLEEMKLHIGSFSLPALKIAVTGGGRVAGGVTEITELLGIRRLTPEEYLSAEKPEAPVYTQLNPENYNLRKDGSSFDLRHFFSFPGEYTGDFRRFIPGTDLLIAAAYWDPEAPVLFGLEDVSLPGFRISVIADITCDIDGSVPTTRKVSTHEEPFYDIDRGTGNIRPPFSGKGSVTVMAVDNLPCALPKDSSDGFGNDLVKSVIPLLLGEDPDHILERATIIRNGTLTARYAYLKEYAGM